jgi:hypothetical protein
MGPGTCALWFTCACLCPISSICEVVYLHVSMLYILHLFKPETRCAGTAAGNSAAAAAASAAGDSVRMRFPSVFTFQSSSQENMVMLSSQRLLGFSVMSINSASLLHLWLQCAVLQVLYPVDLPFIVQPFLFSLGVHKPFLMLLPG